MSGGLRYETGRDMTPAMAEKVAVQIARKMGAEAPLAKSAQNPVVEVNESVHRAPERLISAKRLYAVAFDEHRTGKIEDESINDIINLIDDAPTVIALPVTVEELDYLINDMISYIWKLENKKKTTEQAGYHSRKTLVEKLKKFRNEHFPDLTSLW